MALYIATHKVPDPQFEATFNYILASAALPDLASTGKYLTDRDSLTNIAHKNDSYSELTCMYALYQLLKEGNLDDSFLGLYHYRRYFTEHKLYALLSNRVNRLLDPRFKARPYHVLHSSRAESLLRTEHTIILPKPICFRINMEQQYRKFHFAQDLDRALRVVLEADSSYELAIAHFRTQKYLYTYNMFIMRKSLFCEYTEWLFDMLGRIEQQIPTQARIGYQKRVPAFLAERLFNVWLNRHADRLDLIEKDILLFEGAW